MNRRRERRIKKRISCELIAGERRYSGLVLDVSIHGLFIQTSAKPSPGALIQVSISTPQRKEPLLVDARVARSKLVPPQLRTVAQGGLGVFIEDPPPEFEEFVAEVERPVKIEPVSVLPKKTKKTKKTRRRKSRRRESSPSRFGGRFLVPRPTGAKTRTDSRSSSSEKPAPEPEKPAAQPEKPAAKSPRFRVQLRQPEGEATRSFVVSCETEEEARERVAEEIGDGWKIEGIDRL